MLNFLSYLTTRIGINKPTLDFQRPMPVNSSTVSITEKPNSANSKTIYVRISKKKLYKLEFTVDELRNFSGQQILSLMLERLLQHCTDADLIQSIKQGELIGFRSKEGSELLSLKQQEEIHERFFASSEELNLYPIYSKSIYSPTKSHLNSLSFGSYKLSDLKILAKLPNSQGYEIFKVSCRTTKTLFLLKRYPLNKENAFNISNLFHQRDVLMHLLGCPYFPQLVATFQTENGYYFLLKNEIQASFKEFIRKRGPMTENQAKFYIVEMLLALNILHQKGILLRKIKSNEIYLDPQGHIIIGFIERSKFIADDKSLDTQFYTCIGGDEDDGRRSQSNENFRLDYYELGKFTETIVSGKSKKESVSMRSGRSR